MSHEHHHHHHHHSNGTSEGEKELSFDDKLEKLLAHWIQHNHDHIKNYLDWAKRAKENDREGVIKHLEDAAEKTKEISLFFENALKEIMESKR